MALSTKISEAFQDNKIRESQTIDKYDISDYTILYKDLDRMNDSLFEISNKYKSEEKTIREKILTIVDDYKSTETVVEINKSLIFKTTNPLFSQDIPNDDDDSNRPAKEIQNLQNDLLNIHKMKDFAKIEAVKRKQIIQRYEIYKKRLEKMNTSEIDAAYERKKEKKQAFIRVIRYIKYSTGIILCVVNFVVLINLFTPTTWLTIGLKIYNNKYLFRFFTDSMIKLNLFNITDTLTLGTLFDNMQNELTSKIKDPTQRDEYVTLIIKKIFGIQDDGKLITSDEISKIYSFYDENNNETTKFFNFINAVCNKLNIFNKEIQPKFESSWLLTVFEITKSPSGLYAMSQLGLILNTFAYFERAEKLFNQYSEINPAIILKEIASETIRGESFAIYNRGLNEYMLNFLLGDKQAKVIAESPFMKDLFGQEVEVEGEKIKQLTDMGVRSIFVTTAESFTSMLTNSIVMGYFDKLEKDAEDKNINEDLSKSMDERILQIEQDIRKRGKLILDGLTSEKISSLLNRAPKKNDYKFFAFKFMKHFYNYFDVIDDPLLFVYSLNTTISLSKILENLMTPVIISGSIFTFQNFTLSGLYNINILSLPPPFGNWKINDIVSFVITMFYGNDTRINKEINMIRAKIINEIVGDFQIMLGELQTIFFDTRVGLHVQNYIDKVNETVFGYIFLMSCKIVYYITAIPLFQLTLQNIIPKSNLKLLEIFKDRNRCIKFFSIIRNKISNIFTICIKNNYSSLKLYTELKSFFEIDKIMLLNIIPFVANDGYYSYDTSKPFEFKGNIVTYLNENFDKRLETENKKAANMRSNLLDFQPKSEEIEERIIIIGNDTEKKTISFLKYKYLLDQVINSIKTEEETKELVDSNKFKQDEIFLYYYYSKFIEFKKTQNPKYDISKPKLKDFDDYLSDIANNLRSNFVNSNGVEYALVNSVRILFEERYPKNTWSDLRPFYQKQFSESIKLTSNQNKKINEVIAKIDEKDNKELPLETKPTDDLLTETTIMTIPIQTAYGTVPIISDTIEFFRTTYLINILDSSEEVSTLNTKYADLESKAYKENNNIIFSELTSLEYTLNKPLRVVLKNFSVLKKYIKNNLPGKEGTNKKNEDEKGVTFRHLGFDYNKFTEKIQDYLQKTIVVINNENKTLYDLIYQFLSDEKVIEKIIKESDIYNACLDNDKIIFLDRSGNVNADSGEKVECKTTVQDIKKSVGNKEILMKILFRPEVLIRLSDLNKENNNEYKKYNQFLDYIGKIVDGITIDEKKEDQGKLQDFKRNITIFSVIDEVIDEQLKHYKTDTDIDMFKMNLLKKFQLTLKETVKRGYIDKDLLKYIKQFFKRKEVLLDRYEYINKQISEIKKVYDELVKNCGELVKNPNDTSIEFDYGNINKLKKILEADNFNYTFTLSDFKNILNTIPGGNEAFGNLFNIISQREFKDEENNLVELTSLLSNSKSEIQMTSGILNDKYTICKDITETKLIEKYINNREKWYNNQYKLYKFYLLNISNQIYSELEKKYDVNNKNLETVIKEYEKKLNDIYNKYGYPQPMVPLTPNGSFFSNIFTSSNSLENSLRPDSKSVSPSITVVEKGQTTTTTNIGQVSTVNTATAVDTATKVDTATALDTSEDTALESGLNTEVETGLVTALKQGFSPDGFNYFNLFSSIINMFPARVTTTPTSDISLEIDNSENNVSQENKSAIAVCESRSGNWYYQLSKETDQYDIMVKAGLSKSEGLSCSRNNLTYDLFYKLNTIFDDLVGYINLQLKLILGPVATPGGWTACISGPAATAFWTAGIPAAAAVAAFMIVLCSVIAVTTIFSHCTVYFFHFCLSLAINPIVQDISSSNEADISKKMLLLAWFYSVESLNKIIAEKQRNTASCDLLETYIFKQIDPNFSISEIHSRPKNLINLINGNNDLIDKNGIGVIDIGQKENGKNLSDMTVIASIISNFLSEQEKNELKILREESKKSAQLLQEERKLHFEYKSETQKEQEKCNFIFNIGNQNQEKTLKLVIYSFFEDIIQGEKPILTLNYLGCSFLDNTEAFLHWPTDYYSLSLNFATMSLRIFRYIDLFIDMMNILLKKDDIRDFALTYLFGSSSKGDNINIGRKMIDDSFIMLKNKHTKNGVLNKDEYEKALTDDFNLVFRNFFGVFLKVSKDLFNKVVDFLKRSSSYDNEDEISKYYLDNEALFFKYESLEKSNNINTNIVFETLVKPAISAAKTKFEKIPDYISNINLEDQETIITALVKIDSEKSSDYYKNFELTSAEHDNDVDKNTKKTKAYVQQLINILKLYKKAREINQSQEELVREKIKHDEAGWFNYPFNNYLYFLGKTAEQKVDSSIYNHLINTCGKNQTLVVTSKKNKNGELVYKTECFKLPDNIVTVRSIFDYEYEYGKQEMAHNKKLFENDEPVKDITTKLQQIISKLNINCEFSNTCIDITEFNDEKILEMNNELYKIYIQYTQDKDLEKFRSNFNGEILKRIQLIETLIEKTKSSLNARQNYIKKAKEEEIIKSDETPLEQTAIQRYQDINNEITSLSNQVKRVKNERYKISSGETLKKFILDIMMRKETSPEYFAYLYLYKLNLIDERSVKLSELFQLFSQENLTKESIESISKNIDIYYDDKIGDKIVKDLQGKQEYREKILEMLAYLLTASKKDNIIGEYQTSTDSNAMFLGGDNVINNQNFMSRLPFGDAVLKEVEKESRTKLRGAKIKETLYYELYNYGYYLKTPSRAEVEEKIRITTKVPPVLLAKISVRHSSISSSKYPTNFSNDLYPVREDYIENNGSLTKYNKMIPPILVDYNPDAPNANKELSDFVKGNYVKHPSKNIWVLKMNLALYNDTYMVKDGDVKLDFSIEKFFDAIDKSISYKKDQVESLIKSSSSGLFTSLFGSSYNTDYYDEYFGVPLYQDSEQKKLFFDDNLVIKGASNDSYNTIGSIFDQIGENKAFQNPDLPSIFPLSVFQPNLNNINIEVNEDGDVKLKYQLTKLNKL